MDMGIVDLVKLRKTLLQIFVSKILIFDLSIFGILYSVVWKLSINDYCFFRTFDIVKKKKKKKKKEKEKRVSFPETSYPFDESPLK